MRLKTIHEAFAKKTYTQARIKPVSLVYEYEFEDDMDWQMGATIEGRLNKALKELDENAFAGGGKAGVIIIHVPPNITKSKIEQTIDAVTASTIYDYEHYEET